MDSGQNNSKWRWLWHRLRAMGPQEVFGRARKMVYQRRDRKLTADWPGFDWGHETTGTFPQLPTRNEASTRLRETVAREAARVSEGVWRGFGWIDLKVGSEIDWFCDGLAGLSVDGSASSFELNHRSLPEGADVKLIWELSRWGALSRLAQGAYLEGRAAYGRRVVDLLESWLEANPPFRGWNWTSALESGYRLIQYAWIESMALETFQETDDLDRLSSIRRRLIGPHVVYTKRYLSIGSSANNHLLGELAGLIVARVRWPGTARWLGALAPWRRRLESEILKQFADDGGNREQALNYQVFSFELCWHAALALREADQPLSPEATERLARAGAFFRRVQVPTDPWDYGDSDSAFVAPFLFDESRSGAEWFAWFGGEPEGDALRYWLGAPPRDDRETAASSTWSISESGMGRIHQAGWDLRFDLSALGYLKTAAHGHLDALHLSVWIDGVAMIIDPGTGAYYGDRALRAQLASRSAHNGPDWDGGALAERLGPFLWGQAHVAPTWTIDGQRIQGVLRVGSGLLRREIAAVEGESAWRISDRVEGGGEPFCCRWTLAPGAVVVDSGPRFMVIEREGRRMKMRWDESWERDEASNSGGLNESICSPAFRRTESTRCMDLRALADGRERCLVLERGS